MRLSKMAKYLYTGYEDAWHFIKAIKAILNLTCSMYRGANVNSDHF